MDKNVHFYKLFNAGDYKKVITWAETYLENATDKSTATSKTKTSVIRLAIGSFVFSGDLSKAISLFKKEKRSLVKEDLGIVLFYLSIGQTRAGNFSAAKDLVLECYKLYRKNESNAFIQFGLFQSLGFLSYFRSRFRKSLIYSQKSKSAASKTKDESFIILAEDLYANNQIITGQIYSGIEGLKVCYSRSLKARNLNLAKSIRVTILTFESQYALIPKPIETLKNSLKKIHTQNSYSRNLIWLALLGELLNQGRLKDFENAYPLAQKEIFKVAQHRHQIVLRFKWAHWEFLRFNYEVALLELAKIEESLSLKNDILLLAQIYGLRYKILKNRNPERAAQILEQLSFWQKVTGSNQSKSHLGRIRGDVGYSQSQDKIGNAINEYFQTGSVRAVQQLLAKRQWIHFHESLDHTLIRAHHFRRVLLLGFNQDRALFLNEGNWSFVEAPSILIKKIINQLSIEPLSKEQLVELVWGYKYDPFTHDPMLMTLIQRTRKYLSSLDLKITVSEGIYQINQPLLLSELSSQIVNKTMRSDAGKSPIVDSEFSYRQLQILETISSSSAPVAIGLLLKNIKGSRMTLFRDLRELHLQNRIKRLGKGRGVSYVLCR